MTTRTIPKAWARLIERLELEQPRVVTANQLAAWAEEAGVAWPTRVIAQRLRERGWLLDLTTKGVWEFAPASRAGAFSSGDPLVELRATLARDPSAPYVVGAESAAYLLGLGMRRPEPEVIGAPEGARIPKALLAFRIVRWRPATPPASRDGLPVWAPITLLAFMGARPGAYQDWPNVGEWLGQAVRQVAASQLTLELGARPRSAWARTAYLLYAGGHEEAARDLMSRAPVGKGPYYLGHRRAGGRYASAFDVVDTIGLTAGSSDH
jgi:hypothetical protein